MRVQWIRQFGTEEAEGALGVAAHASGVYVVGQTSGVLPGQSASGGDDAFIRKYDTSGTEVWTRQFGSIRTDAAVGVAVDVSGIYVVGQTSGVLPGQDASGGGDAFIRKYDTNGTEVWTRQFGTSSPDQADGVGVDVSGVYVGGRTLGAFPGETASGSRDAFVRKYDVNGMEEWTRQFGSASRDEALGVAVDASGVYVGGVTLGALPGQAASGSFGTDAFVRKYDINGMEQWTRQFGTTGSDDANAVAVDATGVYVGGRTSGELPDQSSEGTPDAFVRKYDAGGTELWTRQFGTNRPDQANGVAADGSGVYIVGQTSGLLSGETSEGEEDLFVRKYSASGSLQWSRQDGSEDIDAANAVAVHNSGVYVAGSAGDELSRQTHAGLQDAFVLQVRITSTCPYSIASTGQSFPISGGTGSVEVTARSGCGWTAVSNADWITITSGSSGSSDAVDYSVAVNSSTTSRTGTLSIAGLTFTVTQAGTASPSPAVDEGGVVNNASFAPHPAALAPGSIAAVFGSDLNDGSMVPFSSLGPDEKLVTSLGGASVTINNMPVPMFYSTPGQLGVQIPFELAGQTSATIQVIVGDQASVSRTIFVDAVAPGIFTLSQDGRGAAAVLHGDGVTAVTPQSPARWGEIVTLYATGLGAVTPPLATGEPSTENRTVVTVHRQIIVDTEGKERRWCSGSSGLMLGRPSLEVQPFS